jgi:TonB family protein
MLASTLMASGWQGACPEADVGLPVPFCRLIDSSRRVPDGLLPTYPPIMQQAGVSGAVEVEFVVDSTGRVAPRTYRVITSSHPAFEASVRRTVLAQAFPGPVHAGQRVSARLTLGVDFVANPEQDRSPSTPVLAYTTTGSGYHLRTGRTPVGRTLPAPALSGRDSVAVLHVALLAQELPASPEAARALCISVAGRPPETAVLLELRRQRPGAVASKHCPRSYATFVHTPWPRILPKGYLERDVIFVGVQAVWTPHWVVVTVRWSRGMMGRSHVCDVVRSSEAAEWRMEGCRDYRSWVS